MKVTLKTVLVGILIITIVLTSCSGQETDPTGEPVADMANPAAVHCEEQGGEHDIRKDTAGNEVGICVFEDGSECDAWDYFHGECQPDHVEASGGGDAPVVSDPIGLANPASVHCHDAGGTLAIRSDADGNQLGICVFEDGSECEEWAFFRGECLPETESVAKTPVVGWYGSVVTPPASQPYELYLVLSPKESGSAGLVPMSGEVRNTLDYLRDSDRMAHVWGKLNCEVEGFDGCQVEVTHVRPDGPAEEVELAEVEGWTGTLQSLPAGSQFDDVFVVEDEAFPVRYGIEPADAGIASQFDGLRDTGRVIAIHGEVTCGVIDVNGCRIVAYSVRIAGETEVPQVLPPAEGKGVNDWVGLLTSLPEGAQFDDQFEHLSFEPEVYGVAGADEEIEAQIATLRDTGTQVHIWGDLMQDVPDVNGTQIVVTQIAVTSDVEPLPIIIEEVADWTGTVVSAEGGAQIDDYFETIGQNGRWMGIWGEGEIGERLEALRDTGTVIHVWGLIRYNVPDANNAQITVERLEVE